MVTKKISLVAVAVLVCACSVSFGATINVNWDGTGDYTTIQAGINAAVSGADTVEVAVGTYVENINFGGKPITVRSTEPCDWGVVEATIIDAGGLGNAVTFDTSEDANSVITGFTITGADSTGGHGIYCSSTSPVISRCVVTGNFRGIKTYGGSAEVEACKLHYNTTQGISCLGGNPIVKNCLIYKNSTGILTINGSSPTFTNNTIVYNSTKGIGTGPGGATPTITNCIIWNNNDDLHDDFTATYSCISDPCDIGDPNNNINSYNFTIKIHVRRIISGNFT